MKKKETYKWKKILL